MKLLLIKTGKAFGVLKRDGFINGGKRIFKAFFALFKKVGSGDILFITGGVGDSARFRTENVAEELKIHGFKCSITVQDNPFLPKYTDKFNIFIFHRVLLTPNVKRLIENIKKQNKEIIFETDDLVFDSKYMHVSESFKKMNYLEKKQYTSGVGEEILKDPYVKVCTTTTSFLAQKLKEYSKQVFIVKNKLSNKDLEIIDNILKNNLAYRQAGNYKSQNSTLKLGYFSGTISHNKDFATITEPLMQIMEKYHNVELFLVGPLDIENKLNKFKERIHQFSYVPRKKHFENISKIDINLAPLEYDNPFCEAKSELKFFEAGILEIPTVAVKNQTFSETITDGIDGFLAGNNQEWFEKIEKLILNKNLRIEMGKKAREKSLKDYTNKNSHCEEYYNYLKSKL